MAQEARGMEEGRLWRRRRQGDGETRRFWGTAAGNGCRSLGSPSLKSKGCIDLPGRHRRTFRRKHNYRCCRSI